MAEYRFKLLCGTNHQAHTNALQNNNIGKNWMDYYYLNGEERVINQQSVLVSEADSKGKIRFANEDFCKISGYELEELIGQAHSIVRHEDMPKSTFVDMWKTLKLGHTWAGFIKNSVKNSDEYYWVYARIYPIIRNGERYYISCRKKATEDEIKSATAELRIFS
jgi:PAS domain S-box-containing protein